MMIATYEDNRYRIHSKNDLMDFVHCHFLDVCVHLTYQKIENDVGDQHIKCKKEDDRGIPVSTIRLPVICIFEPCALLI